MGRGHRVVALWVLALGCGDGQSGGGANDGDDADAAAGIPDGAASDGNSPDAGTVPFEDRTWGDLEMLDFRWGPQVAIDSAGNVMTVWERHISSTETPCLARRRAIDSGSWGAEQPFVTPAEVSAGLERPAGTTVIRARDYCANEKSRLRVDAAGGAVALYIHARYLESDDGSVTTWWSGMRAMYDPDSDWSEPVWSGQNSALGGTTYALAMNGQGTAALGWTQSGSGLWVAGYQPDAGWQEPVLVFESHNLLGEIVLDERGDGLAVFDSGSRLWSARLADGAWQPPVALEEDDSYDGSSPGDLAMNGAGEALMIWRHCIAATPDQPHADSCDIWARSFDPVSGWAAPAWLAANHWTDFEPNKKLRVAIDAEGNGLAAWVESWPEPLDAPWPDDVPHWERLGVARFRHGAWMAAEILEEGELGDRVEYPRVVLDGAGHGLVGSYRTYGGDPSGFQVRTYDPDAGFGPVEVLVPGGGVNLELAMNPSGVGVAVWYGGARMFR